MSKCRHILFWVCCGGRDRTTDLQVMSLTSYHCSTPRYITSYRNALQRYNKNCTYANFFRKKCIFWQKIAYGLQFATVTSGECAFAQAASEGTTVSLIGGQSPHITKIFLYFLAKNMIFLCIFLRICVFFSNFAPYFVRGYGTRARNGFAE